MKRHNVEPESPAAPPSGPAPSPPPRRGHYLLQGRPEPGSMTWVPAAGPPGRGTCVFTELLTWSKLFFAFHTGSGEIPETSRHELERGLSEAIRNAEEFMKD